MHVSKESQEAIAKSLDDATKDSHKGIAGIVFIAVDKEGNVLAQHAAGKHGHTSKHSTSMDTTFWIASCTKMITGLACMQLVEQGKVSLDDADIVEKTCPELKDVKILKDGELHPKKNRITLRMLLTHTAGFGYTFFHSSLRDHTLPAGGDEFSGDAKDVLDLPLMHEPGEDFHYGTGIDWAGQIVERISGQTLDEYFKEHIFAPLGIKNISFHPDEGMRSNLAHMHQRLADGTLRETEHLCRRALRTSTDHEKKHIFNSGGGGCFAQPKEYVKILSTLLNDGTSPETGKQILKPETVEEMFKNQIPNMPNFARQDNHRDAKPLQSNRIPQFYPQEGDPPQGWGLTFMLTIEPGPTGRGRNTGWWAGLANLFWWADREKGVAGMIASQTLPFGDAQVMGQWGACEKLVYDGLEK